MPHTVSHLRDLARRLELHSESSSHFIRDFPCTDCRKRSIKGSNLCRKIYEKLGFKVVPDGTESRHDIIQAVEFNNRDAMIAFCEGIQAAAPVDSYVTPEPWAMPGYDSDVIMAAGAFVQGSSIELSADGPVKPPYAVYFQGGLTWYHAKLGILMSLQNFMREILLSLIRCATIN